MRRFLLLLLAFPLSLSAQSRTDLDSPAAFTTSGAFFAVSVADLDASTRWYSEKLGLRVARQLPKVGKSSVVILAGGGLIVELVHNDEAQKRPTNAVVAHGLFKAGVIVDSLDRTLTILRARGVQVAYGPFPARPDALANAIIRDNEGNLIQFFGR